VLWHLEALGFVIPNPETIKNGILIPIVTSKESHFNADFKYVSFIKFSFTQQKL